MRSLLIAKVGLCMLLLPCLHAKKHEWGRRGTVSKSNMVYGGQEGTDPDPTYVCRARYSGSYVPGKYVPYYETCYIAVQGEEKPAREYQLLVDKSQNRYKWEPYSDFMPNNPVVGGTTLDGEPIFICRTQNTPVSKYFWSGEADLVGNTNGKGDECIAPWSGDASAYTEFEVLVDTEPSCVPREKWVQIFSFKNYGNSDQIFTREYSIGTEERKEDSNTFSHSKTKSEESGFSVGANIKGIKAEFSSKLGVSSTTNYDWTQTNSILWRKSEKHTYPFKVLAGTHGILKQLVGYCGKLEIDTEELVATSKPFPPDERIKRLVF